jgi:hypothetical protein
VIDAELLNRTIRQKQGVRFIPFRADHVDWMEMDDPGAIAAARAIDYKSFLAAQSRIGTAITVLLHGTPVAVFGCVLLWPGVAEMWSILTPQAREHPIHTTRVAKSFRDIAAQSLRLRRLQMTVRCSDLRAVRWALAIGFSIEGAMQKYLVDGADAYIMGRVYE